jgi:hypothetical protein
MTKVEHLGLQEVSSCDERCHFVTGNRRSIRSQIDGIANASFSESVLHPSIREPFIS